jgi:hypothetical protein
MEIMAIQKLRKKAEKLAQAAKIKLIAQNNALTLRCA